MTIVLKTRSNNYGNKNAVGKNIEKLRKKQSISQKDFIAKLQVAGLDINPTSYSKLEGQIRVATDREIFIIAHVLGVSMETLFQN